MSKSSLGDVVGAVAFYPSGRDAFPGGIVNVDRIPTVVGCATLVCKMVFEEA